MAKLTENRTQVLTFETSPEELRELANHLEKTDKRLITSEATFFLNADDDNFMDSISIRFIKSK